MIIAVDQEIRYWEEAFSRFGSIRPFSGRSLKAADVRDIDALVVRSITPVDSSLLNGSRLRFVASASAGVDHVDQEYLKARGIHFAFAAGCNADSVSEYIVAALHIAASRRGWELNRKSLGVIGVGNVGSRVSKKAAALGMKVLLCDPPLRDLTGDPRYQPLDEVTQADILTFHVPLSRDGAYPTWHMLDRRMLDRLSPEQYVINSSRGPIFDNREMRAALEEKRISGAVLDVWEEEPVVDYSLLELVDIGTPHIAGTALDGKIRATEMVREEMSRFFGIRSAGLADSVYPESGHLRPAYRTRGQAAIASVLRQAFDLLKTDAELRALGALPAGQAAAGFDRMRKDFPLRLEFHHFIVDLDKSHIDLSNTLRALGFQTSP